MATCLRVASCRLRAGVRKGGGAMFSLQTKRAICLTKTTFQLKCKLYDNLMPLYMRV